MNQILKTVNTRSIILLTNNLKNVKHFANISKDIATESTTVTQSTDLLINNLKNAKSVVNVLELVKTHNDIMNSSHTIEALRTIFTLQKHGNSSMSTPQILKHPDFERICNQLKRHAGAIELNETIDALKVMTFVGVSSNSTIYQILLQLLRHSINQMSLHQIIFTDFLLSKVEPCPLVEALKVALPIVYDIQVPIKLDQSNSFQLADHLHYISKKNVSENTITLIVNSLMKVKVFQAKTSVSIIWSICDMQSNTFFEPLLKKAIKSLLITGYSVPYYDLETTVSKLIARYSLKTPFYYNQTFFDYCAKVAIGEDVGFETAIHLLRKFIRVNHTNTDLLNYISEKCHQNPALIENGDPVLTYNLICGCALTEHRPKYYDTIKESFLKIKNYNDFLHKDFQLIKFQASLSILDIYIPEILEQSLNEDYLRRILKRNYISDLENVLLISQAIKTLRPEFCSYLPSDSFLKEIKMQIPSVTDHPLLGVLYHVFGGEKFVKTQPSTKMFHHIDHLIVLKRGGFASALNVEDKYVEDIHCESPAQIVLVLGLRHFHYTINNKQLLGSTSLMLQTLEAKGYTVVPISLALWKSLPEFEKIPYIMEAIKSKTEFFDRVYDVS